MLNPGYDNELDHLSREAAGKYTTPGEPNWQKMQEELDRALPVQTGKRRTQFLWWALPALLLIGGGTYWLLEKKQDAVTPILKTVPVTDMAKDNRQASPKETAAVPHDAVVEKNKAVEPGAGRATEKITASNRLASLQKNRQVSSPVTGHSVMVTEPVLNNDSQDKITLSQQTSRAAEQPVIRKATVPDTKSNANLPKETSQVAKDESIVTNQSITRESEPAVTKEPATPELPASVPVHSRMTTAKGPGWSYALLAGVDKSTVKFSYGNDPGYNIGLLAGYHFNNKLSLHTGAIYTQKNYKLAGADFTAPKGSWVSYYKLENVTGYCRMWEVPLLLRYTVSDHGKNSVYLSTGLSSYFMTSEDYNYFFYTGGQPVTRNAAYPSSDTHIMSIVHFSAGFESRVSKTLSLQIEPYAKIPLGGLGLGNISLSSFGVNFSVQHRQPSKK